MDTCGIITEGNFSRQDVSLTGPTQIEGGNWEDANITPNGHRLVLNGGEFRGLRINGIRIDGGE